jgi:hypothetical protein
MTTIIASCSNHNIANDQVGGDANMDTQHIRLHRDQAARLIAQRLRDYKLSPTDASKLAEPITAGLLGATPASRKPGR